MTQRLTENIRNKILNELIKKSYSDRIDSIISRKGKLALDVYNKVYDGNKEKFTAKYLQCLEDGLLSRMNRILISFGGLQDQIRFSGNTYSFFGYYKQREEIFLPFPFDHRNKVFTLSIDDELSIIFQKLNRDIESLENEIQETKREIKYILLSFNTFKQLKDNWPEITEIVEEYEVKVKSNLPSVPIQKINEKLGIKME